MKDKQVKNIYQRINDIKREEEVEYATKDQDQGKYKTISHDKIASIVRDAMVKHGVVVTISLESSETTELPSSRLAFLVDNVWLVKFVNIDMPEDFIEIRMPSQIFANDDKASGKSCSYAMKYALLKTLGIISGDDEESILDLVRHNKEEKVNKKNERETALKEAITELDKLTGRLNSATGWEDKVCKFFTNNKKSKIEELNNSEFDKAEKEIFAKLSAMTKG